MYSKCISVPTHTKKYKHMKKRVRVYMYIYIERERKRYITTWHMQQPVNSADFGTEFGCGRGIDSVNGTEIRAEGYGIYDIYIVCKYIYLYIYIYVYIYMYTYI